MPKNRRQKFNQAILFEEKRSGRTEFILKNCYIVPTAPGACLTIRYRKGTLSPTITNVNLMGFVPREYFELLAHIEKLPGFIGRFLKWLLRG